VIGLDFSNIDGNYQSPTNIPLFFSAKFNPEDIFLSVK
jgi:hypothetical protein